MKRFVSVKALFMAMVTGLLLAACGDDGVENTKPGGQGNGSVENRKIVAKIVEKSSSEGSVVWDGDIEEMSFSYDKQGRLTGITYSGDDDEEVDKVEYLYEKNSVRISLSTWLNGVEVSEEFDESRVALNEKGYAVSYVNSYYPKSVIRNFLCKKSDYSRLCHRYSICMLTQYADFALFQDKMKANFSNDRFRIMMKMKTANLALIRLSASMTVMIGC